MLGIFKLSLLTVLALEILYSPRASVEAVNCFVCTEEPVSACKTSVPCSGSCVKAVLQEGEAISTVRTCSGEKHTQGCQTKNNDGKKAVLCHCDDKDGCNSAGILGRLTPSQLTILAVLVTVGAGAIKFF